MRPKGICSFCRKPRLVKKDGTMGIHAYLNDKGYMVNRQCSGVDLPPEKMAEVFDNNAPSRLPITDRGNYRG